MNNYLLDSDILIWCLRKREDTVSLVQALNDEGTLGCSAACIVEIQAGAKPHEVKRTSLLLDAFRVYPLDRSVAHLAGKYLREHRMKGITLDFVDSVVAATAVLNDLILVTYNTKHYPMSEIRLYQK